MLQPLLHSKCMLLLVDTLLCRCNYVVRGHRTGGTNLAIFRPVVLGGISIFDLEVRDVEEEG